MLARVPERKDIQEALREAVDRTFRATVDTRERAQDAAGGVAEAVDDLLKGAERNLTRSSRSMRAAVEDRLPATQDDVKALRAELRRIDRRLEAIENRLGD
jgi:polyhydroxyalkanoate synthesis regulator phasin